MMTSLTPVPTTSNQAEYLTIIEDDESEQEMYDGNDQVAVGGRNEPVEKTNPNGDMTKECTENESSYMADISSDVSSSFSFGSLPSYTEELKKLYAGVGCMVLQDQKADKA